MMGLDGSGEEWTCSATPGPLRGHRRPGQEGRRPAAAGRSRRSRPAHPPAGPGAAAGAAATAHAATRGRPRPRPSPARVHGVSDSLEGGGLREERTQVRGGYGASAGGAHGTEGRLPAADGRVSCRGTAGDRSARPAGRGVTAAGPGRGQPGASRTPTCPSAHVRPLPGLGLGTRDADPTPPRSQRSPASGAVFCALSARVRR